MRDLSAETCAPEAVDGLVLLFCLHLWRGGKLR
jgi:hypothetical protein